MTEPLISPIRPDQIPQAARVMANAFADAPRYTYLLPDASTRYAKLPWYWKATIRAAIYSGGIVHVAQESGSGVVLGVTIWTPPERRGRGFLTRLKSGLWAMPISTRYPGMATPQGAWPVACRPGAVSCLLAPGQHWRRSIDAARGCGHFPNQSHAAPH